MLTEGKLTTDTVSTPAKNLGAEDHIWSQHEGPERSESDTPQTEKCVLQNKEDLKKMTAHLLQMELEDRHGVIKHLGGSSSGGQEADHTISRNLLIRFWYFLCTNGNSGLVLTLKKVGGVGGHNPLLCRFWVLGLQKQIHPTQWYQPKNGRWLLVSFQPADFKSLYSDSMVLTFCHLDLEFDRGFVSLDSDFVPNRTDIKVLKVQFRWQCGPPVGDPALLTPRSLWCYSINHWNHLNLLSVFEALNVPQELWCGFSRNELSLITAVLTDLDQANFLDLLRSFVRPLDRKVEQESLWLKADESCLFLLSSLARTVWRTSCGVQSRGSNLPGSWVNPCGPTEWHNPRTSPSVFSYWRYHSPHEPTKQ